MALALTALPGGGGALNAAFTLLTIAFFTAIAYLAYRLYRQFGMELDTLEDRQRLDALRLGRSGLPRAVRAPTV